MIELRDYQIENSDKLHKMLLKQKIAYFNGEMRVGKTITALQTCKLLAGTQPTFRVVFATKKKAMGGVEKDAKAMGDLPFTLEVVSYDSLHKVDMSSRIDVVIGDELHVISAFPKPSKRFKEMKKLFDKHTYLLALSGTISAESSSQLYHQFNVSQNSPFKHYVNFYAWAKDYVKVTTVDFGNGPSNNYSGAIDHLIDPIIKPYLLTYTQKEANFEVVINESLIYVDMKPTTYKLIEQLKRDRVVEGKKGVVLADTAVKLQSKIHQLCSGTIKFESGESLYFDTSKAEMIREEFAGQKIAIVYIFKEEFAMLKEFFPNWTDDAETFNESSDKVFLGQVQSIKEGTNLSSGDALIFYNIHYSGAAYIQARQRMATKDRAKDNNVYFVFSRGGIEDKIYDSVSNKMDYNNRTFKRDFGISSVAKQSSLFG